MDLDDIKLLIQVVELGSIQRAASQFNIPRSSLRRRLATLEASVGCELFVRSATGVALTPAGAIVLSEGRTLLAQSARMVSSAKASGEQLRGTVVVVVPTGMPPVPRMVLFRAMESVNPGICIEEVERDEPLDHLHEPFDLMLHFGAAPERSTWFSRTLLRVRLMPLASEAYLQEHGRPNSLEELARHRILGWRVGRLNPKSWPLWDGGSVAVDPVLTSHNGQFMHRAAQHGLGILLGNPAPALLPEPTPLIPVLESEIGMDLAVRCLSPLPGNADPRTRSVLEGIRDFLRGAGDEA